MDEKEIIEKVNKDYLQVINSKEYRFGSVLFGVVNGLKKGHLQEVTENIKLLWQGVRVQKYNSKTKRYKKIQGNNYVNKIAVYAALFGQYDNVYEPFMVEEQCDYYIFTDQEIVVNSCWKKMELSIEEQAYIHELTDVEKNRYFKMLGYRKFLNYDYSIYIDINLEIYGKLSDFPLYALNSYGLAMFNHPTRDCIFNEAHVCIILGKVKKKKVNLQMKKYLKEGMPRHYGMCECGVIVRDNANVKCYKLMKDWWHEFRESLAKRDQLLFPYVLWKNHIKMDEIGCLGENISNNGKFRMRSHFIQNNH